MSVEIRAAAEVFPPGDFIREELEARDWTQADLASILGKPLPAVNELIKGKKAITPDTARALGDAFGTGAPFWMNLESAYRLALSQPCHHDVSRRAQLYSVAPIADMVKRRWIDWSDDIDELERDVLNFFDASTLDEIRARMIAVRKSTSDAEISPAEWAWFCRARQQARTMTAPKYSEQTLRDTGLDAIHQWMVTEKETQKLPQLLTELGIRFVVVERLPRQRIDGAAFWLDDDSPAIAVTMRLDRIDGFWFTLAHELAHILNRDPAVIDFDLVGKDHQPSDNKSEIEQAADRFAGNFLEH